MMKLQTPVTDEKCKVGISYNDRILMLGSCFSDNIGRQLSDFGFDVCINPFGTLYNPVSILQSIRRLASGNNGMFCHDDLVQIGAGDERWCSFSHHTSFARDNGEDFIDNANARLHEAQAYFASCSKIVITFGTSWCFRHTERNMVVSNCLKRPASEFIRERLSTRQVKEVLDNIAILCKGKELIFTVSPIRHFKDGAHGNQLSKSALLVGIDDFLEGLYVTPDNEGCCAADYFPAYEIVMDELRDYRFYAEDMCHPTAQTTCYIRDRFLSWALPECEKVLLEEKIREHKRSCHISL